MSILLVVINKKEMKNCLVYIVLIFTSFSCFNSDFTIFESECGDDINLGKFQLSEATQEYIPYIGNETLIFEDSTGKKYKLNSIEGLLYRESVTNVRNLCYGPLFNVQSEYYDTEEKEIAFQDSIGNEIFEIKIWTTNHNSSEIDTLNHLDSIAIYDSFTLTSYTLGIGTLYFSIITDERQNQVPSSFKEHIQSGYRVVGDTIIQGKSFKDVVFAKRNVSDYYLFFSKEDGVVAFKPEQSPLWVLKK